MAFNSNETAIQVLMYNSSRSVIIYVFFLYFWLLKQIHVYLALSILSVFAGAGMSVYLGYRMFPIDFCLSDFNCFEVSASIEIIFFLYLFHW